MTEVRRYTFKLYPTPRQAAALARQAALLAQLWNSALEQRETQWAREVQRKARPERKGLSCYDQQRELKDIRRDDPEFAAMSASSLELTIKALDLAFQAFFRRAKAGAGRSSGYPRYKSIARASTIPHRDGSGWKLHCGAGKNYKIYAKGVPGLIRARGKFPAAPEEIRTMELIHRDGAWWASIVVKMAARRTKGTMILEVAFDLIDEFAAVKNRANGQCVPGWDGGFLSAERANSPQLSTGCTIIGGAPHENWGEPQDAELNAGRLGGGAPPENWGEPQANEPRKAVCVCGAAPENGGEPQDERLVGKTHQCGAAPENGGEPQGGAWSSVAESCGAAPETRANRRKQRGRQARRRKDWLHKWTTALASIAGDMLIVAPPVKQVTKSGRGTEHNPGAAVKTIAAINRAILEQAPSTAIEMLQYKMKEAGATCTVITAEDHHAFVGQKLGQTTKIVRKAARKLRQLERVA